MADHSSSRRLATPYGAGRRSRTGCMMCKRRKKRCDELRPKCSACIRLNLLCQYLDPSTNRRHTRKEEATPRVGNFSLPIEGVAVNSALSSAAEQGFELPLHLTDTSLRLDQVYDPGDSSPLSLSLPFPRASDPVVSWSADELKSSGGLAHEVNSLQPDKLLNDNEAVSDSVVYESFPSSSALRQAFPDLEPEGVELFEYFRDYQSGIATVSPVNRFQTVFLAISLRCRSTLYALIGWAGWHKGDEANGQKYFTLATKQMKSTDPALKEEVLASLLCMASGKICSGDVSDWRQYMQWAANVIRQHGGLSSFLESESVRWLLKNFAYHEILASTSLKLPILFSSRDFAFIFAQETEKLPDTLCACCEGLFIEIVAINELARDLQQQEALESNLERGEWSCIMSRARMLERQILNCRPDTEVLANLSVTDMRLQVVLFELFQKVAVLHLHQCVLHVCSRSPMVRGLANDIHILLPQLLCSQVEGAVLFPLFIAGVASWKPRQRESVKEMFDGLSQRVRARNVRQCELILEKVWHLDQDGTHYVDWNELASKNGIALSFA